MISWVILTGTNMAPVLGNTSNPYTGRVNSLANKYTTQSILGSAYADVNIIKGLTYTNQIGFQYSANRNAFLFASGATRIQYLP